MLVDQNVGIKWTTLIRFEETLQDQEIWNLAAKAGCCTLYYGMESANERVLNLMDKHAKKSVIQNNLHQAAKAGIWNHVLAFYGFPGETRDEALETRQFVIDNQPVIHSVELFYFVAYRIHRWCAIRISSVLRSTNKRTTICPWTIITR
jgi:radical SAM superfamily enzyme YgiQ (UPF0313 family)